MSKNNQVKLIGNLGSDVRITVKEAFIMASFSLATTDSYKDENDKWQQKKPVWHNVLVFHEKVIEVAKTLKKGTRITVEGTISYKPFEVNLPSGNGTKREASIIAGSIIETPLFKSEVIDNSEMEA